MENTIEIKGQLICKSKPLFEKLSSDDTIKTIAEIRIRLLPLLEQSRINNDLSSIDDLIINQGQKIDTLKFHKNRVIQHFFSESDKTR